jgi:hypothetical protein
MRNFGTKCKLTASLFSAAVFLFWAAPASAHQPRLVTGRGTVISNPEVSQAYYGELDGEPAFFWFDAPENFSLYVGVSVPDIGASRTDFVVEVFRDGRTVTVLDGPAAEWRVFHEELAGDSYLDGPEFRGVGEPGKHVIRVSNPQFAGKYVLTVGEVESFSPAEAIVALFVIPRLKTDFFGNPTAAGFLLSILGPISLVVSFGFGLAVGWLIRFVNARREAGRGSAARNIGISDRLIRLAVAFALFGLGLIWWSYALFAAAGFVFFEAFASWCALNAYLGRNTCPATLRRQ